MPIYSSGTIITSDSLNNREAVRRFLAIGDLLQIASNDAPFDYFILPSSHIISAIDMICPGPTATGTIQIDLLTASVTGGAFTSLYTTNTKPSLSLTGGSIAFATFTGANLPNTTSLSANIVLACKIISAEIGAKDLYVSVR